MSREHLYSVLFLLLKEQKKVYMDISFAQDLGAVLRKHWCGEIPYTRECFSYENPQAKPEMLVWKIGYASREVAGIFLQKWEEAFLQNGFAIIASQVNAEKLKRVKLGFNSYRWEKINFDDLMQGVEVQRVTCRKETRNKKAAAQKYTTEVAEDVLNIRTTWSVSHSFRKLCKERGLTQSQGLYFLVESANGEVSNESLKQDLHNRLRKADKIIADKEEEIQRLRRKLQEEVSSKKRPSQLQAAIIQNLLLRKFFDYLPKPVFSDSEEYIGRYGFRHIRELFPEEKEYHFPEREGVYLIYLECCSYAKGRNKLLHIYGKTQAGEKLKFIYPYAREKDYGKSLWDSEYLIKGYPWLFGVQKPKEIASIIGALPVFDLNRILDWYSREEDEKNIAGESGYEDVCPEDVVPQRQLKAVDELIKAAENIRNPW